MAAFFRMILIFLILRGARVKHEVACTLPKRAPGVTSNSSEEL